MIRIDYTRSTRGERMNQNERVTVGSKITLTATIKADGFRYRDGETGIVSAVGVDGDPTIVVLFRGRPALCLEFDEDWTLTSSRALVA